MKARLLIVLASLVLAACDKGTAGGGTAGGSQSLSIGDGQGMARTKAMDVSQSDKATVSMPAALLLFSELARPVPRGLDKRLGEVGASALSGDAHAQLAQLMGLATRPLPGWPVDPLDSKQQAEQWAKVVGAAIVAADEVGRTVLEGIPARAMADEMQARAALRDRFLALDARSVMDAFQHNVNDEHVMLDLSDTGAVRFVTGAGQVSIDGTGATLTRNGVVVFGGQSGALGGRNIALVLEKAGTVSMSRQRVIESTNGQNQEQSAGVSAGVK